MYWLTLSGVWILLITFCSSIPTPIGTTYNATSGRETLLIQLCEDLEKGNAHPTPARGFGGNLDINSGQFKTKMPQYSPPE